MSPQAGDTGCKEAVWQCIISLTGDAMIMFVQDSRFNNAAKKIPGLHEQITVQNLFHLL